MTITHIRGDLFAQGLPALGHGCNTSGSMAGGIAVHFRALDERMYREYRRRSLDGSFRLGDVLPWHLDDGRIIYNLATQLRGGPDARLDAISTSVAAILQDVEQRGLDRVGVPRIGSGIGGLAREAVDEVLTDVASTSTVELVVVTRAKHPH